MQEQKGKGKQDDKQVVDTPLEEGLAGRRKSLGRTQASENQTASKHGANGSMWKGNRLSLDHLSINRLPRIIVSHTSCHPLFFLPSPCQVEVESDPAKLINDNSNSDAEDIDIEN